MPHLIHSEHRDNPTPTKGGDVQDWDLFKAPTSSDGAWVISAFPELLAGHGAIHHQALTIEDVVIYTHRDKDDQGDEHLLRFRVRNVGTSTIQRYSVNVWHIEP